VDGDGAPDLAIGARRETADGKEEAGRVHLFTTGGAGQ